jgi:hypothetical protein
MFLLIIYLFFECNYSALGVSCAFSRASGASSAAGVSSLASSSRCSFFSFSFYSFRFVLKSRNNFLIGD